MDDCCCLCSCGSRQATIVVGIVASFTYFFQLVTAMIHQDFLIYEFSQAQYNAFIVNHVILLLICIIMLIGAIRKNKWMLIPFIIFVGIQDFLSFLFCLLTAQRLIVEPSRNEMLTLFLVSTLNFFLITWILCIVTRYFRELHYGYVGSRIANDEESKPILLTRN